MDASFYLPLFLGTAVLLPLLSFVVIILAGSSLGQGGKAAGTIATSAILGAAVLSFLSLFIWVGNHWPQLADHGEHAAHHVDDAHDEQHADDHANHEADAAHAAHADDAAEEDHAAGHHAEPGPVYTKDWYVLGEFGKLQLTIGYYIDALTVCMFCMVTLIASCIHFYATGYMHDELHDFTDPEVTMSDGSQLTRPGRYPRFFQSLSLFCFSMLGLVVAGNIAMTFVFWELVGICSYFLIGFYVERKSASNAANKAFITNRIGDFGMIIGLMALWGALGTFNFGQIGDDPGLFESVRPAANHYELITPVGMVQMAMPEECAELVRGMPPEASFEEIDAELDEAAAEWRAAALAAGDTPPGYWLLVIAGVGIFCGCVGKSAQFPLHVWLPDAMEGPTPVSALVHSATMVAAGVFLVARFFPMFAPEVLLVIAICGTITLFIGATIAITATDIKRVLAYSTVSQLGYMMMALGVGGWLAGVMHLFTHAFFKSLLFLCSGSVIHAVHTNEMTEMGGLRKKMPYTAYTMLIGCLAIAGAGVPFLIGFSGYYSKDSILEQAFSFRQANPGWGMVFFLVAAGGAALTSFYMFRIWYLTFAGQPRDPARYAHAHESPAVMYMPLVVIAVFAIGIAWRPLGHGRNEALLGTGFALLIMGALYLWYRGKAASQDPSHAETSHGHHDQVTTASALSFGLKLAVGAFVLAILVSLLSFGENRRLGQVTLWSLLEQARPAGTAADQAATLMTGVWPDEHFAHLPENFSSIVAPATIVAFGTALTGFLFATVMYCWRWVDASEVKRQFSGVHRFLLNKWWFDELYDKLFIQPTHWMSGVVSWWDRGWIDRFLDGLARGTQAFSVAAERLADQGVVDGFVNKLASFTYDIGIKLRGVQTGRLRQYVMFIGAGTVAVFALASFFWGAGVGR